MYVDNGMISNRQTFRLYVFDLMGIATLLLPPYLAKLCGLDGVWAIVLGTGAGFVYLFYLGWIMKSVKVDMNTYLRKEVNGVVRVMVLLTVCLHSIVTAGFCSYVFAKLMQYSLVQKSSYTTILLVIVVVAAYAVAGGIESRARTYEVLFFLVLIPYVVMMLASIKNFEVAYVQEVLKINTESLLKGTYLVFLFYSPLFYCLFLIGEKEKQNGKNVVKTVAASICISGVILVGSYFLLVGNFGITALGDMQYPVVTLMSTIQFKGNFLKRMDALMVAVWFFTLYALLNLHLHYGVHMLNEIFYMNTKKKGKTVWLLLAASLAVYVVGIYFGRMPERVWTFVDYYSYVALPYMVVVPGLLLLIGRSRGGKSA